MEQKKNNGTIRYWNAKMASSIVTPHLWLERKQNTWRRPVGQLEQWVYSNVNGQSNVIHLFNILNLHSIQWISTVMDSIQKSRVGEQQIMLKFGTEKRPKQLTVESPKIHLTTRPLIKLKFKYR